MARKKLAGPPSEFELHRLPSTVEGALSEQSAWLKLELDSLSMSTPASFELPVDSPTAFGFSFFSPYDKDITLDLTDPSGKAVPLDQYVLKENFPLSDDGLVTVPVATYLLRGMPVGIYTLGVSAQETFDVRAAISTTNDCLLSLWNDSPLKVFTYLSGLENIQEKNIGLVTRVYQSAEHAIRTKVAPVAMANVITTATLDVVFPDNSVRSVPMQDDGKSFDELAADHIWGATVKATAVGRYRAQAVVRGTTSDGVQFLRTTQHLMRVVPDEVVLSGVASVQQSDVEQMTIDLTATSVAPSTLFRVYAEVYGTKADGTMDPACWIGGMSSAQQSSLAGQMSIPLELNVQWLVRAGVTAPLVLRNVYVVDANTNVPVAEMAEILVKGGQFIPQLTQRLGLHNARISITREMQEGRMPAYVPMNRTDMSAASKEGVVLLHGYCSKENPWQANAHQWTDGHFFLNPGASLSNEEFAQKVVEFAAAKSLATYGIVGHSQGGIVALHIANFYFTGLDGAKGPRKIQSVGTPYHGNSAAGSLADIGKVFGITCGSNEDLTTDGSNVWLSGITTAARSHMYYYTTQYATGGLVNYCNLAVNFVLKWPNDGTAEYELTSLSGGNNMGHKKDWCHSLNMKSPPQFYDASRNAEMNSNAAR